MTIIRAIIGVISVYDSSFEGFKNYLYVLSSFPKSTQSRKMIKCLYSFQVMGLYDILKNFMLPDKPL